MRTRRRIAALVVSAAALGVGFVAFPAGSAAAPPVVPTCAFPATAGAIPAGRSRSTGSCRRSGGVREHQVGRSGSLAVQPGDQRDDQRQPEVRRRHRAQPEWDPVVSRVGADGARTSPRPMSSAARAPTAPALGGQRASCRRRATSAVRVDRSAGEPDRVHDDLQGRNQQRPDDLRARSGGPDDRVQQPGDQHRGLGDGPVHGRPDAPAGGLAV